MGKVGMPVDLLLGNPYRHYCVHRGFIPMPINVYNFHTVRLLGDLYSTRIAGLLYRYRMTYSCLRFAQQCGGRHDVFCFPVCLSLATFL